MATQEKLSTLTAKLEQTRTVITNLKSFKDWNFEAYRLEQHEKDIVIEGLEYFKDMLEDTKKVLEATGEVTSNDNTDLCE